MREKTRHSLFESRVIYDQLISTSTEKVCQKLFKFDTKLNLFMVVEETKTFQIVVPGKVELCHSDN